MNLYRGCSHGCIYCDSRSTCYHMEHDFEDIAVKENAIELLEDTLKRKRSKCMLATGSMTDPYIPLESEIGNVRTALSLEQTKCVVQMTLTTYDENLCRKIEPNVSTTKERFEALKQFRDVGIPTVVWLSPILPFINDTEENLRGILHYCIEAKVYGVICFGMGFTLREGNREYFYEQLDRLFPGMKEQYIQAYGNQYGLNSPRNSHLMNIFHQVCEENHIVHHNKQIFEYLNTFEQQPMNGQLSLFD